MTFIFKLENFLKLLLFSTLLLWMFDLGSLNFIPISVFTILLYFYGIKLGDFFSSLCRQLLSYQSLPIFLYLFFSGWILLVFIFRYYSLYWNIWDVGIHTNILYNIAYHNEYYSSFLNMHGIADHFTPSFALLSFFYKLFPHTNWMMFAKAFAYISCPYLFWQISKHYFKEDPKGIVGLWVGLFWLVIYKTSVASLFFSFQASSLSLPFILISFILLLKQRWFWFFTVMVFLLGFKENLAVVWISFGFFIMLNSKNSYMDKKGILLFILGFLFIYIISFIIMPHYRNNDTFYKIDNIGLFDKIPKKISYIFLLFTPLLFLPIIFFRIGSIALPSIGLNLITNNSSILSTKYHYDDINSVLLMISIVVIFSKKYKEVVTLFKSRFSIFILLCLIATLFILPNNRYTMLPRDSMLIQTKKAFPTKKDFLKHQKLKELNRIDKDVWMIVHRNLGSYIYKKNILPLVHSDNQKRNCINRLPNKRKVIVVLDTDYIGNNWLVTDLLDCENKLKNSSLFKQIEDYPLQIFIKN